MEHSHFFEQPFLYWLLGYFFASAVLSIAGRVVVRGWLPDDPLAKNEGIVVVSNDELEPAEFAYLLRDGDLSHTLSVLAVDLTQRAVKSRDDTAVQAHVPAYESGMWKLVTDQVRSWTNEQKESLMIESLKKNPVAYVKRMSKIYKFFTETLSSFVVRVTKDPKQLRRYFSVAGIMRLVADFSSAGYQQMFENQLKADLVRRGLLVSEDHRNRMAYILFGLSGFGIISTVLAFILLGGRSTQALSILVTIFIATVATRLLYGLKELLPYLGDIVQILRFLNRRSWRIFVLRFLSRYIRALIATVCFAVYALPVIFVCLLLNVLGMPASGRLIVLGLLSSLLLLASLNLGLRGLLLLTEEYATIHGAKLVQATRRRIGKSSPLESFVQMLQSKTYDKTFSEMVALYGIETLLFLA